MPDHLEAPMTAIQKLVQVEQHLDPALSYTQALDRVIQADPALWEQHSYVQAHGRLAPIVEKRATIGYEDVLKTVRLQKDRMAPGTSMKQAWTEVLGMFDAKHYPEFHKAYLDYFRNGAMASDFFKEELAKYPLA